MKGRDDIGSQEGSALLAMAVLPTIFLLEPSLTIERSATSAHLVKAGGGVLFLALLWWVMMLYGRYAAEVGTRISFMRFIEVCLGTVGARIVYGAWLVLLAAHLVMMLRLVAESTAKTALQQSELLFPLVLIGGTIFLGARYRLTAILRASYLMLALSAVLIALLVLLLLPMWEMHFLLPWQGYGIGHTMREVGLDVGTWCAGSVLLLLLPRMRTEESGRKSLLYGVGAVMLIKCAVILSGLCVFGSVVGGERSFLFYEMAKLVHFSQYIQRVEAVFVCVWLILVFFGMAVSVRMSACLASDLIGVEDARPLTPLFIALISVAAASVKDLSFAAEWSEKITYAGAPLVFILAVGALTVGYYRRGRRA